jgi:hypothetical protein
MCKNVALPFSSHSAASHQILILRCAALCLGWQSVALLSLISESILVVFPLFFSDESDLCSEAVMRH